MSVIFKLIGYQSDSKNDYHYTPIEPKSFICLKDIYLHFIRKDMNIQHLKQIKFISNGETITELDKKYDITIIGDSPKTIFIFTNDHMLKQELLNKIFTNVQSKNIGYLNNDELDNDSNDD